MINGKIFNYDITSCVYTKDGVDYINRINFAPVISSRMLKVSTDLKNLTSDPTVDDFIAMSKKFDYKVTYIKGMKSFLVNG